MSREPKRYQLLYQQLDLQKISLVFPELISSLKAANCPYPRDVAILLKKRNLICKVNFLYVFSTPEPIHYKVIMVDLEDIYFKYKPKSPSKPSVPQEVLVEEYIKYLKNLGYKIYKPITEYKEL